jgi:DMSO/TMAO reductase YedYZ heme-binding membrane subunit
LIRKTLGIVAALLVAFHVWLFGSQLWEGQLVDGALIARWALAAGLVAALAHLRRRGLSMVWGRHAVAIWLLAALLHGPSLARDLPLTAAAPADVIATLAQTVITIGMLGVLLLLGLVGRGRRHRQPLRRLALETVPVRRRALAAASLFHFAPRPPPLA